MDKFLNDYTISYDDREDVINQTLDIMNLTNGLEQEAMKGLNLRKVHETFSDIRDCAAKIAIGMSRAELVYKPYNTRSIEQQREDFSNRF